ncbi:hopanoid biosynthesis-associated protein HpnK [Lichenicoccus sp.]|uniref:hopanoid biosynthesis-associated protein HpnK n=1 Tax=Lichenicoccus sp. TaxID=2781899 RepID=UPI003D0E707B
MRRVIISADDFGLSETINEAVEQAHTKGLLTTASLMVGGAAAADAVARARRLPNLRVGLHLVVIEGPAILSHAQIPALVGEDGQFPSDQAAFGFRAAFRADVRAQLQREIAAQFAAFAATGLALDHANAHKHMHLHPVVGRLLIAAGLRHGLRAIRIPSEPAAPLAAVDGTRGTLAAAALRRWTLVLRAQARQAGLRTNASCFGLAWSGAMTSTRVRALATHLPPGLSEIYFHPATTRDDLLTRLMPDYHHHSELAALCDPEFRQALKRSDTALATWT